MATPTPAAAALPARLIAEVFGTFVLVFAVIGTALYSSSNTGYLGVAFAVGLAVMVAAYAVGSISGGHFNPAVTLGVAAAGRMLWRDVLPYIVAQIVGGFLASTLLFAIAAGGGNGFLAKAQAAGFASNGYGAHSPGGFDLVSVILVEVILTALFLWVILNVTRPGSTTAGFAPLAIGLTLTVIHLVAIPVSNASVNPARSIATAIYGGGDALGQLWVFLVFPIVGALIAGFTYKTLFARTAVSA
ncbi:MAG: aquaporin [Glaciihabitans sp.]|jgi:aquaporin Z|nr:aquaporin [Glaciihabitans sp.]MDQ1571113.1 aquaporin [Actinomycetota bacterium]